MEKKILLVDDDVRAREMFYNLFSRKGYKVFSAAAAQEGIELIRQERPDLVLMDIKMPKMDGIQALKNIREVGIKTRIVMLTGVEDIEAERQARLHGASGFLRKALDIDIIAKAVDEILKDRPGSEEKENRKVLVVDDEPRIREVLEKFLAKKGFQPITAASGEEALEKVMKEGPIVVLSDIKMPGMDGIMLLKRIREINEGIGVIMITAVGDEDIAHQAIELGAYDYIVKPLDFDYLEMCLLTKILLLSTENV